MVITHQKFGKTIEMLSSNLDLPSKPNCRQLHPLHCRTVAVTLLRHECSLVSLHIDIHSTSSTAAGSAIMWGLSLQSPLCGAGQAASTSGLPNGGDSTIVIAADQQQQQQGNGVSPLYVSNAQARDCAALSESTGTGHHVMKSPQPRALACPDLATHAGARQWLGSREWVGA